MIISIIAFAIGLFLAGIGWFMTETVGDDDGFTFYIFAFYAFIISVAFY